MKDPFQAHKRHEMRYSIDIAGIKFIGAYELDERKYHYSSFSAHQSLQQVRVKPESANLPDNKKVTHFASFEPDI